MLFDSTVQSHSVRRRPRFPVSRFSVCAAALLFLAGCEPRYVYTDCLLPTLTADVPVRTLLNMGDPEDMASDVCPVPTARKFEARRSYGTMMFGWWDYRLYIAAAADDGRTLDIRGAGIEIYENDSGQPWFSEFSHRKRFAGDALILSRKPAPERFTIEILGPDGRPLDTIEAIFDTTLCSCAVPEGMGRPTDSSR
jgi:hypothetical protein